MNKQIKKIDENKKNIRLSNCLIEAKYRLSLNEQKILHLLIAQIDINDNDLRFYTLTTKDFNKIFDGKNNSRNIKNALDNLQKTIVKIKEKDMEIRTTWLASSAYYKGGKIELEFSQRLKPYLINLKEYFTRYNLDFIVKFESKYSVRIYQLLKQYENIKNRIIDLEELKEILEVKEDYLQYGNFKQKVLLIARREINFLSDIEFEFEEIKEGRKVTAIKFIIHSKLKKEEIKKLPEPKQEEQRIDILELIEELQEIILEPLKIRDLKAILKVAGNNLEIITEKYKLSKMQEIENLTAWLIKAIEEDYQEPVKTVKKQVRKAKKQVNTFNNFSQRNYTAEEMEEIEKRLLQKSMKNE